MLKKGFVFCSLMFAAVMLTVNFPSEADHELLAAALEKSFVCDDRQSKDEWINLAKLVRSQRIKNLPYTKQENEIVKSIVAHENRLRPLIRTVCVHPKVSDFAYGLAEGPTSVSEQFGFLRRRIDTAMRNFSTLKERIADLWKFSRKAEDRMLTVHYHRTKADYGQWVLKSAASKPPETIDETKLFGAKYEILTKWYDANSRVEIIIGRDSELDFFGRTLHWKMTTPREEIWLVQNVPEIFTTEGSAANFIREHTVSEINYLRVHKADGNYAGLGLHIWKFTRHSGEYRRITEKYAQIDSQKYSKGAYFRLPIEKLGYTERVEFTLFQDGKKLLNSHLMWHLNRSNQAVVDVDSNKITIPSDKKFFLAEILN